MHLRRVYLGLPPGAAIEEYEALSVDVAATVEAREALQLLLQRVPADMLLLCEVAAGYSYDALAIKYGCSAGELRTRVSRLRSRYRELAPA
jgi:DNA-directed RNA polymerase specialized sigma24 family protein